MVSTDYSADIVGIRPILEQQVDTLLAPATPLTNVSVTHGLVAGSYDRASEAEWGRAHVSPREHVKTRPQ